jgi:hypothetical protein
MKTRIPYENKYFQEGIEACKRRSSTGVSPYPEDSEEHRLWYWGFIRQAYKEHRERHKSS